MGWAGHRARGHASAYATLLGKKVLFDLGYVFGKAGRPFRGRGQFKDHLGEDNQKLSKSRGKTS